MDWIDIGFLAVVALLGFVAVAQLVLLLRQRRLLLLNEKRCDEAAVLLEAASHGIEASRRSASQAAEAAATAIATAATSAGTAVEPLAALWAGSRSAVFAAIDGGSRDVASIDWAAQHAVWSALDRAFGHESPPFVPVSVEPAPGPVDASTRERELKQLVIKFTHDARNMLQHLRSLEREKTELAALLMQHGIRAPEANDEATRNAA